MRATSSHITAALIAGRALSPIVNTPWLRMSTAGERWPDSVCTTPAPDLLVADQRERPERDRPAELIGHRGERAGDSSPRAAHAVA